MGHARPLYTQLLNVLRLRETILDEEAAQHGGLRAVQANLIQNGVRQTAKRLRHLRE